MRATSTKRKRVKSERRCCNAAADIFCVIMPKIKLLVLHAVTDYKQYHEANNALIWLYASLYMGYVVTKDRHSTVNNNHCTILNNALCITVEAMTNRKSCPPVADFRHRDHH